MNFENLDNLVKAQQLKVEPFNQIEFIGLISSGKARLKDANMSILSIITSSLQLADFSYYFHSRINLSFSDNQRRCKTYYRLMRFFA